MSALDTCSLKKSLPLLIALLVIAQIDLASAYGWPNLLLSLLHLTPAPDGHCRGICAGLGTFIDFFVIFQLARICAKRAMQPSRGTRHD
ncbi:MAG TPA: hypothetical protein VKG86_06575 [Terracidiphilus sp.]|nr:hypothetical protein [Terracidiphilus sp.]